jgi:glycosyltransferase involved in cell wall biosynthesis
MPAFNAAESIRDSVCRLRAALSDVAGPLEFVVVDDGSCDDTASCVRSLAAEDPAIRLLRSRRNLGKGLALHLGVYRARHPKVLLTDADAPFSTESYRDVVRLIDEGAPIVLGSRRLEASRILIQLDVLGYAFRRHLIGIGFNRVVRLLTGLPYTDTQCGLKALDRDVALELFQHLRLGGFIFDVELMLAARAKGIPAVEAPVCIVYEHAKSGLQVALDSWRMGLALLRVAARDWRGVYRSPALEITPERLSELADEADS